LSILNFDISVEHLVGEEEVGFLPTPLANPDVRHLKIRASDFVLLFIEL
jgi:hypothetical protein